MTDKKKPMPKTAAFRAEDLGPVSPAPPPDDPPLIVGDWCTLNSGSPPLLVVDADENSVVAAMAHVETTYPRACVRRTMR